MLSSHRSQSKLWCTGEDSNLRSSQGAADLQSAAINRSATCARLINSSVRTVARRPRHPARIWPCPFAGKKQFDKMAKSPKYHFQFYRDAATRDGTEPCWEDLLHRWSDAVGKEIAGRTFQANAPQTSEPYSSLAVRSGARVCGGLRFFFIAPLGCNSIGGRNGLPFFFTPRICHCLKISMRCSQPLRCGSCLFACPPTTTR